MENFNFCVCAVLFLLLLSGESLKWAKLSTAQQHYVATVQILLTTGVAVAVVLYAITSFGFVRQGLKVSILSDCQYSSQ